MTGKVKDPQTLDGPFSAVPTPIAGIHCSLKAGTDIYRGGYQFADLRTHESAFVVPYAQLATQQY